MAGETLYGATGTKKPQSPLESIQREGAAYAIQAPEVTAIADGAKNIVELLGVAVGTKSGEAAVMQLGAFDVPKGPWSGRRRSDASTATNQWVR